MRIVIAGATGNVGRKVARNLQESTEKHTLVLLSRRGDQLRNEESRGAKIMQGDLEDAVFLKHALEGAEEAFWMIPPRMDAEDLHAYQTLVAQNEAEACRANGVNRVVFLSSIGAHIGQGLGPVDGLRDGEDLIRAAVPNVTILRPAYYMENFLATFDGIIRSHTIMLPVSGSTRAPMIATEDVARAAADALTETAWTGVRTISLLGPRDYSFDEAAAVLGRHIGVELRHVKVSPEQARGWLTSSGASESVAKAYVAMMQAIESGDLAPEAPRSKESTTSTTLERFARAVFAPAYNETMARAAQPIRL